MTLANTLHGLLNKAQRTQETQQWTLARGLKIRVAHTEHCQPKFCLWRDEGEWGPGTASECEGHVCAKALGWADYELYWKGRFLVVREGHRLLGGETQ